jgi:hypothetical protein
MLCCQSGRFGCINLGSFGRSRNRRFPRFGIFVACHLTKRPRAVAAKPASNQRGFRRDFKGRFLKVVRSVLMKCLFRAFGENYMAKFLYGLRASFGLHKALRLSLADITQMSACEKHLREANLFGAVRRVLATDSVFQG